MDEGLWILGVKDKNRNSLRARSRRFFLKKEDNETIVKLVKHKGEKLLVITNEQENNFKGKVMKVTVYPFPTNNIQLRKIQTNLV